MKHSSETQPLLANDSLQQHVVRRKNDLCFLPEVLDLIVCYALNDFKTLRLVSHAWDNRFLQQFTRLIAQKEETCARDEKQIVEHAHTIQRALHAFLRKQQAHKKRYRELRPAVPRLCWHATVANWNVPQLIIAGNLLAFIGTYLAGIFASIHISCSNQEFSSHTWDPYGELDNNPTTAETPWIAAILGSGGGLVFTFAWKIWAAYHVCCNDNYSQLDYRTHNQIRIWLTDGAYNTTDAEDALNDTVEACKHRREAKKWRAKNEERTWTARHSVLFQLSRQTNEQRGAHPAPAHMAMI